MPLTKIIKNLLIIEVFASLLGTGCVSVMDKDRLESIEYQNTISTQESINRENNKSEKTKKAYMEGDTLFIKGYSEIRSMEMEEQKIRSKNRDYNHSVYGSGSGSKKDIGGDKAEAGATLMFIFPDPDSLKNCSQ